MGNQGSNRGAGSKASAIFLGLCSLGFIAIGINTFVDPIAAMAPVDLGINTLKARNELLANYGGMQIGIGLYLLAACYLISIRKSALLAQCLIVGGLACGRLASLVLDGNPGSFNNFLLGLESSIALISLVLAFVAEFSRGKSELINAIFFADAGRRASAPLHWLNARRAGRRRLQPALRKADAFKLAKAPPRLWPMQWIVRMCLRRPPSVMKLTS